MAHQSAPRLNACSPLHPSRLCCCLLGMSADPAFTAVLQALTGAKESIKGASAALAANLQPRSQLLVLHARGLASQAGSFPALQRLVFVANDALFSLASSKQPAPEALLAALSAVLPLAAAATTEEERGKLTQLCRFWRERGLVDDSTTARLLAACSPTQAANAQLSLDEAPADDVYCAVGALPLLVRARGAVAPYTPLSREAVMAAPLAVPFEPAYIQSRLSKLYEDLGRHSAAMDVAAADSNVPVGVAPSRRYDSSTNTFGDGTHAGSRGGHTGLGSTDAGAEDADFYATYRAVRPMPSAPACRLVLTPSPLPPVPPFQARARRYVDNFR